MSEDPGSVQSVEIPDWLTRWPCLVDAVRQIGQLYPSPDHLVVLRRLAADCRMRAVWTQLATRDRKSGAYQYPAKQDGPGTPDEAQARALRDTLRVAFSSTIDDRRAGTMDEVFAEQARLRDEAKILRAVADDIFASLRKYPHADPDNMPRWVSDAHALRRVADWREGLAEMARTDTDPVTIKNHRGDDLGRGVAATMGAFFLETFGKRFDGTAANVASVSCGVEVSEQAVRSAHSKTK